mgnify:CR=1 FL=1
MADDYTYCSFLFDLTPDQTRWASSYYEALRALEPTFGAKAVTEPILNTPADVRASVQHWQPFAGEFLRFKVAAKPEGLWIHDEEEASIDQIATFVREILRRFDLPPVGFEWSYDSSQPHLAAYGGGAVVVSRSGGEWLYTHRWLDAALGHHHRGAATAEVRDLCACDDCGWTGALEETQPIRDFWSRVEPGGIMPAGECPRCGVLAYLLTRPHRVAVIVEGGLVQAVVADRPDELRVAVVDYDTEGSDAADLIPLELPMGRSAPARVRVVVVEPGAILLDTVFAGRD